MITEAQLRQIMPNLPGAKAQLFLPHLNDAMGDFGIDNPARTAAFLAQLAHESGEFRWMEEIWGPTPAQRRYEPPSDLAARLGNNQAGDGKRYKGRGPIQITGRFNYRKYGDLLGVDLVGRPEQAALPEVAFRVAGLYWKNRGLNELADVPDFKEITRRINGGFNGLADRQKYFERARAVIAATGFVEAPATRSARAAVPVDNEPLTRGAEAIRDDAARARKAPAKKAAAKKTPARKTAAKKAAAKKATPKKTAAKKAPAKKLAAKEVAAKKVAAKKTAVKKAAAKKVPAKKAPAKKVAARKVTAKRPATKKAAAKRAPAKKAGTRKPAR